MLEQHSQQRFCHGVSVVDVFNQKVQTKIKAIIDENFSQLIVLGVSIMHSELKAIILRIHKISDTFVVRARLYTFFFLLLF